MLGWLETNLKHTAAACEQDSVVGLVHSINSGEFGNELFSSDCQGQVE